MYIKKLKISNTIIKIESRFPHERVLKKKAEEIAPWRLNNFIYRGNKKHHILIKVMVAEKLPVFAKTKPLFASNHSTLSNWHVFKTNDGYIFKNSFRGRDQLMKVNETFDKVRAFFLPVIEYKIRKKSNPESADIQKKYEWNILEIVYDFLQVLFINYLAYKNEGILIHSSGIKYLDRRGIVFSGNSGSGKTTLAKIWFDQPDISILNDDRIIIKKNHNGFMAYSSPWHGMFKDYLLSKLGPAKLNKIFFIYHESENICSIIPGNRAFKNIYPNIFSIFWNKACIENAVSICKQITEKVPSYSLGFKKDKRIINFVNSLS